MSRYNVPDTPASAQGVSVQPDPTLGITGPPPYHAPHYSDVGKLAPPGEGKRFIEHISTFQTRLQSYWSKIYINSDEAYTDSINNATAMRRDPIIMQPLRERQIATCLLDHEVLPENERDPVQKKIAEELSKMILHTPFFTKMKLALMEAIWYSKYGVNLVYGWEHPKRMAVQDWIPVHGDKIRHEHETGRIGIMTSRVGWLFDKLDSYKGGIRVSDESRVQMVPHDARKAFVVHKHEIEDGSYYDGRSAGMIHGVGLRTRVYWPWWFKQKLLQWIMEFSERVALGVQLWYYEAGNDESYAAVQKAAEEQSNSNVILFPRPIGAEKQGAGYERIEPSLGGAQFFGDLLDKYWGAQIRKMIIGQSLTSEADSTGLGSNIADQHRQTFVQLVRFDALNLAETLTQEYLAILAEYNYPGISWKPRLELIIQHTDPKRMMEAAQMIIEMGGTVSEREIREVAGLSEPKEDEKTLSLSSREMPSVSNPEFSAERSTATPKSEKEMKYQEYSRTKGLF